MYLSHEQQKEMYNLMNQYLALSKEGTVQNPHSDAVARILFGKYVDKIIHGVIYSRKKSFYANGDPDELFQEARIAVLKSIHKRQWDPLKGTIFTFFTTVVIRNLKTYTTRTNKKRSGGKGEVDIELLRNAIALSYDAKLDAAMLLADLGTLMDTYFAKHRRFHDLFTLMLEYFCERRGERFTKREFCLYAADFGYRSRFVNTFFTILKNSRCNSRIVEEFFVNAIVELDERHEDKYRRQKGKCEG